MYKSIHSDAQSQIEELFLDRLGWEISLDNKYSDKKMHNICKSMGFTDIRKFLSSFNDNRYSEKLIQEFAQEFSIGETYFFRDKKFFNIFENKIIPQFLKEKDPHDKNINIWSVGSSSGEEAYSVAMMLDKNIHNISSWNITILGTDINIDFLKNAKNAKYSKNSLRTMPQYYKERYLKEFDGQYKVLPSIKKNVHFEYHNIADKTSPSFPKNKKFDLILLKNVLIYFEKQKASEVVDFLYTKLKNGGRLSTTPIEYASDIFKSYKEKNFTTECMIQKSDIITVKPSSVQSLFQTDEKYTPYEPVVETVVETVVQPKDTFIEQKVFNAAPFTYYEKSCELLETGETQEAKKFLRKCLYLDRDFLVALISLGNILKKEGDNDNSLRYINKAKEILSQMDPSAIVDYSGSMTTDELLAMINHENILDKGVFNANS